MGETTAPAAQKFYTVGDKDEFDPEKWKSSTPNELPKRDPETHVKVLIVGAGFAGLMTALECWRKGHNVVGILERNHGPNYSGDLIIIQPSAIAVFRHWPDMLRELEEDKVTAPTYYYRHTSELIYGPSEPSYNDPEHLEERENFPYVGPVQIRKKFYTMLLRQVAKIGIKVDYGQRVDQYFEDEQAGVGGVVMGDGSVRVADIVVAADAFKSRSELLIAGKHMPTQSSGMSVYRVSFPAHLAMQDEEVRKRWEGVTANEFWLGAGMHIGLYVSPDLVAFGITPRDEFLVEGSAKAKESWDPDVDPEEVIELLRRLPGWHPAVEALIRATPRGSLIHWPLLWRNLRPEWTSRGGRVVQVGDCAHSTIPASVSGGTLALEDAITLASSLQVASHGGPSGAPLGAKVYNLLRYQRVSCTQKMAFVNSQLLNATSDWDAIMKDRKTVRLRFPKWVFNHDPEAYVYEKYGQAFAHLVTGAKFENTNFPPGHKFVPWTIEDVYKDIGEGKKIEQLLDGDWS
ncbi:Monooxygenase, FAD-binding [Penicillium expansum]|uniref:Monooxygenase, FAD-binding n=1 Tax=Penicillium expansum TaxID=27334 RepID=A0A0A2KAA0_PENEN|nr:Monooxygenase, FAD-binding [Penicillium expansum]KGO39785.1 Monooxygenase, FAD-binding [Penicillium expansum]KGO48246.1 Monooxygenase, FAD-binding [Penicillium expansum]KGO61280.1 Monooxygenase, FAD-binding [Penicillium expansum]